MFAQPAHKYPCATAVELYPAGYPLETGSRAFSSLPGTTRTRGQVPVSSGTNKYPGSAGTRVHEQHIELLFRGIKREKRHGKTRILCVHHFFTPTRYARADKCRLMSTILPLLITSPTFMLVLQAITRPFLLFVVMMRLFLKVLYSLMVYCRFVFHHNRGSMLSWPGVVANMHTEKSGRK